MGAWELKHEALMLEWREKVMACRSSGISVKKWCEEQGIDRRKVSVKCGTARPFMGPGGSAFDAYKETWFTDLW